MNIPKPARALMSRSIRRCSQVRRNVRVNIRVSTKLDPEKTSIPSLPNQVESEIPGGAEAVQGNDPQIRDPQVHDVVKIRTLFQN